MVMLLVDEAHHELLSAAVLHSALGAVRAGTTESWVRSRPHHRVKIVQLPDGNFKLIAEYVATPKPPASPPPPPGTMPKNVPVPKMKAAAPKVKAMPKTKATTKAKATSSTTTTPLLPTPKRTGTLKRCLDLTSSSEPLVPETQLAENAMDCT